MKFTMFSDFHHCPQRFMRGTFEDLDTIFDASERANVDFIIHAGDLTFGPSNHLDFVKKYNDFHIPTYNCLGNHDTEHWPLEKALALYRMPHNYYYFDRSGYRFILLDANYSLVDGEYVHYNPGAVRHKPGVIPPEQLAWLEQVLAESTTPCILLSHHSIERPDGILNRQAVWEILCRANRRRPHTVMLYVNGHHHRDYCTLLHGVCCLELNSASYQYVDPPHPGYAPEVLALGEAMAYTLNFSQPLSARITLEEDTQIRIRGAEGTFLFDLTQQDVEAADAPHRLSYARRSVPYIRDYDVDLVDGTVTPSRD